MTTSTTDLWLTLQSNEVRKNVKFLSSNEVGKLYHVSINDNIKKFVPFISRRANKKENITVPRVSTAPTLFGCMLGYLSIWTDVTYPKSVEGKYKNGWYLYDIPYDQCIKPNSKLLFDQEISDEHWLVSYDESSREYKGNIVAKLFYSELRTIPKTGEIPVFTARLIIEVMSKEPVRLGGDVYLTTGYWSVDGKLTEDLSSWKDVGEYKINKLSPAEYFKLKGFSADMLSREPVSFRW